MSTYDDIAEWYDRWVGTHSMGGDPFFPAVEALMGEPDRDLRAWSARIIERSRPTSTR